MGVSFVRRSRVVAGGGGAAAAGAFPSWLPLLTGGTAPVLFADFSTEGAANNYWYNNSTYGSFAAWSAAIGGAFTRASTASYTNSSGLLVPAGAASNAIRFDYAPVTLAAKGLLLEGASTNLLSNSNNFAAAWADPVSGHLGTRTQNLTGPDGAANSGWTFTGASNAGSEPRGSFQNIVGSITANVNYTASIYAQAGSKSFLYINLGAATGHYITAVFDLGAVSVSQTATGPTSGTIVATSITNVGGGWFRCSIVGSLNNASSPYMEWGYADAASGNTLTGFGEVNGSTTSQTIGAYGAQFEQLAFASSYIPTTSGAVTKAADILDATPSSPFWNGTAFSLFGVGTPEESYPGAGSTDFSPLIEIDDNTGSFTNNIGIDFNNQHVGTEGMEAYAIAGGVSQFTARPLGTSVIAGTRHKLMIAGQASDFAATVDGLTPTTQASGSLPSAGNIFHISIGFGTGGTGAYWGTIRQLGYWNVRASNADLQRITT